MDTYALQLMGAWLDRADQAQKILLAPVFFRPEVVERAAGEYRRALAMSHYWRGQIGVPA